MAAKASSPLSDPPSILPSSAAPASAPASPSVVAASISSSSVGSNSPPADSAAGAEPYYRDARQLPPELRENVTIYLEEKMYSSALHLAASLLHPGASQPASAAASAIVLPPAQLAVLSTLAIHPAHTSSARDHDSALVAALAMDYLDSLVTTVGPVNARLRHAFEFGPERRERPHSSGGGSQDDGGGGQDEPQLLGGDGDGDDLDYGDGGASASRGDDDEDDLDENLIRGRLANDESIWTCARDFWKVIGWALNCSALHPQRWLHWKPWLDYMVHVLEADFDERRRLDLGAHERAGNEGDGGCGAGGDGGGDGGQGCCDYPLLRDSLLLLYLAKCGNRMALRGIIKALLADGDPTCLNLFPQVFPREIRPAATPGPGPDVKRKRPKLDLENGKFGDYFDDEDGDGDGDHEYVAEDSDGDDSQALTPVAADVDQSSAVPSLAPGLEESIPLRLRVFYLLARAALELPERFVSLVDVYETFSDGLRDLPPSYFGLFMCYTDTPLPSNSFTSLLKNILRHYLPASIPNPAHVDPYTEERDGVSALVLQRCYLPFAANNVTPDTNAKMSLILENLLRLVYGAGAMSWSAELQNAAEKGVKARTDRARVRKGVRPRGTEEDEDAAREVLKASGQRILALMDAMRCVKEAA